MVDDVGPIKIMVIDASGWKTIVDMYDSILQALGAPGWHGQNVNALVESMVWDDMINTVKPPYALRVHSTGHLSESLAEELGWLKDDVEKARANCRSSRGYDVDVTVDVLK